MIGGVSFQPGQNGATGTQPNKPKNTGVQEAIKVLSLRLPTVVGARAMAPQALLESPGSGGNPRVDSVVSQVMGRMFPTGQPAPSAAPTAPMVPPNTPQFGGEVAANTPLASMMPQAAFAPQGPSAPMPQGSAPRITPGDTAQAPPSPIPEPGPAPEAAPKVFIPDAPPPPDGGGNVMNDFLEFLRRNQTQPPMEQEPPPSI